METSDSGLAVASAMSMLESTLPMLEKAGFQKLVFEDFYEVFASLVENIVRPDHNGRTLKSNPEMLLEAFQLPEGTSPIKRPSSTSRSNCVLSSVQLHRCLSQITHCELWNGVQMWDCG